MRRQETIKIKFRKQGRLTTIILIATLLTVAIIVVTKIGFSSVYATSGDIYNQYDAERNSYIQKNKALESEIAELQSVSRIEKEATERLHMVKASPVVYLDIKN